MMGHKICFYGDMWVIIPKSSLPIWSTAVDPNSYMYKHGHKHELAVLLSPTVNPFTLILLPRPWGYKSFFVLSSAEHEILNAHKYKNVKKFSLFQDQASL